jgi:hypothetical protein
MIGTSASFAGAIGRGGRKMKSKKKMMPMMGKGGEMAAGGKAPPMPMMKKKGKAAMRGKRKM